MTTRATRGTGDPVDRTGPSKLDEASIVATAGCVVDSVGPEALTMTRIAEELGVTQPALYRHVGSMSDVWRLLGLSTRAMLVERLVHASLGLAGPDAVRAVASAWRSFALDHPGRYRSTDRHAAVDAADLESAARRTIDVLDRILAGFGLSDDRRHFAATTLRSSLHGFASFELTGGHPGAESDAAFDALVTHLVDAFETAAR